MVPPKKLKIQDGRHKNDKDESQNQWLKKVHDALTEIGDGDHVSEPAKVI